MSISGFKDTVSEQSTTESANEAAIGPEQEGGVSPDTVSAASQSIDEPTKDIVSPVWRFYHLSCCLYCCFYCCLYCCLLLSLLLLLLLSLLLSLLLLDYVD